MVQTGIDEDVLPKPLIGGGCMFVLKKVKDVGIFIAVSRLNLASVFQ